MRWNRRVSRQWLTMPWSRSRHRLRRFMSSGVAKGGLPSLIQKARLHERSNVMSLSITTPCVNCWACVDVCPNDAIVEAKPHFYVETKRCTECDGEYADPQCASICPIEGAILN